ncbi:MAG: ABC transporter ATP-binding protein [Lachnospiraceae bacterium]|jgi:ATP-binding cassette subfamily B protein|nr:ABC transporter ATP-binding protein [Lachnospiraceae bacterium]
MEVFKFGFRQWKKHLALDILTKLLSFTALTADLLLPLLTAMFINYVIKEEKPEQGGVFSFLLSGKYGEVHSMQLFWTLACWFLGLILLKDVIVYVKNYILQKLGLALETDLRVLTFHKLMELDSETVSEYNTGELLTTLNSDTIMFKELFCRMIPNIFDSIYVLILAVVMLASINHYLLIIPVILTPFFAVALLRFRKLARDNFRAIRGCNSTMSLTVQENIEAVRLVRSFTNEELEKRKFDKSNVALRDAHVKQIKLSSTFEAVFGMIRQVAYIGSIAVAAVLVMHGQLLVGYLVACADYVFRIMNHVTQINNSFFQMQQQLVSGKKMLDFMNCESKIVGGEQSAKEVAQIHLKVEDASLAIQGQEILKHVSIDITPGKKIGIVGGTGSGKSVLLESLIRVHDVSSGRITLNGTDIREYDLDSLRQKFSYVFQDVFLFSNTITSNIAYSEPEVERQQIQKAAEHAQAHGFIMNLLDGYETIVGERGLGISGGQKQRVSIARALLRDAPILVLDDSTSALDVNTEKKLLADIKKYYPDKTLLISAHRLSSVVDCDEILFMRDGSITERGSFDELMKQNGDFAKIYNIQKNQEGSVNFDALADAIAEGGV